MAKNKPKGFLKFVPRMFIAEFQQIWQSIQLTVVKSGNSVHY